MKWHMMKIKKLVAALLLISGSMVTYAQNKGPIKIGFITDGASLYSDIDGIGGKEAMEMAIADFGGTVLGRKVEILYADHQNKADIAAGKAREWIDQEGVNVIFGGTNFHIKQSHMHWHYTLFFGWVIQ